jgi:hypothetical protein
MLFTIILMILLSIKQSILFNVPFILNSLNLTHIEVKALLALSQRMTSHERAKVRRTRRKR